MNYLCLPMRDVPREWGARLRQLSFGPYDGTMVRWSYHDGSTWAVIAFEGEPCEPPQARHIVGWSCLTLQEEPMPVIGVFVDEYRRGRGIAAALVRQVLSFCRAHLTGTVYAVQGNYAKYPELLSEFGQKHLEWE